MNRQALTVCLIGRPNVGKSSLFNRLMGRARQMITYDRPGVTRDRHYGVVSLQELPDTPDSEMILIDTGGFYPADSGQDTLDTTSPFFSLMREHIAIAIDESDLILFVTDARQGLLPLEESIAHTIRSRHKPFWVLANKCDSDRQDEGQAPFYSLSAEKNFAVSASHGRGISHLRRELHSFAQKLDRGEAHSGDGLKRGQVLGRVALIGTPNTGKSTLLNQLTRTSRSLVSEVPGTTLDPVEGMFNFKRGDQWHSLQVLDTAGIRKKSSIRDAVEAQSVFRALKSITECDVALLLIDAEKGIGHQGRRLIDIALDKGKSVIIAINKMDKVEPLIKTRQQRREWWENIKHDIPWSNFCQLFPISAQSGKGLHRLLRATIKTLDIRQRTVPTGKLNHVLQGLLEQNPVRIRGAGHKAFKIKYASMAKSAPPTFLLFSNRQHNIPQHYQRYLKNGLRRAFAFDNTPIRLVFRRT